MKTTRILVLGLLMSVALGLSARTYVKGEKVYVNVNQSFNWSDANAKLFLYFYQSWDTETAWLDLNEQIDGNIYAATWGADKVFDRMVVVRKNTSGTKDNWDNIWNQSCDIEISDNGTDITMLNTFKPNTDCSGTKWEWKNYAPPTSKIKSIVSSQTAEEMSICLSSVGDPLSLKAKLKADKSDYEYSNVKGHAWYSSKDGSTWTSIDGLAGVARDGEGGVNIMHHVEADVLYYYLHSNMPAGCRLIRVTHPTEGCDLDCKITSFATAISAVNADDSTFTLDGMVAFGKANGSLVIECDGHSSTIATPKSPQTFSLPGVKAAVTSGQKKTVTASFTGDGLCSASLEFDVPNATQGIDVKNIDELTGNTLVLTPTGADPDNDYVWIVVKTDGTKQEYKKSDGQAQTFTVDGLNTDSVVTVIYKEYNPPVGTMDDLMANGGYEDDSFNYGTYPNKSTISDYNFWGLRTDDSAIDFYSNSPAGVNPNHETSNGFAVVKNSNYFAPSYATVKAREGSKFALFDAATGAAGGNKKAWYAKTANNPDLKLKAGTTYVLSFWAANINNYGEMDNAARFKFRIEKAGGGFIGESAELDLSKPEFRNNIWHQHSETFLATEDCDNVIISVVNLNTNNLAVGNDFALDDIQFHPISSVSRVVKSQQKFIITAHEPKVDAFTATVVPINCDAEEKYTIQMHVTFQNPKGQLIIKDKTTDTEYPYDVTAAFDTPTDLNKDIVINGLTPVEHQWEAYFSEWPSAKKEAETTSPVVPTITAQNFVFSNPIPNCELTTTLTFDLDYTYQQGDLTYWVDGLTAQTATYTQKDRDQKTLTALTFANIPADGKDNHVLHVSFDGPNSCVKDFNLPVAPFSPVIDALSLTTPTIVPCDVTAYEITVAFTPHYSPVPDGKKIILTYDSIGETKTTAPLALTDFPYNLIIYNIANGGHTIFAAFEDAPDCKLDAGYDAPARETCERDSATICEGEEYWWHEAYRSGPVGENRFKDGTDSLYLFVKERPTISIGTIAMTCDDANEVRIPFSPVKGTPDNFDIDIVGSHFAGTLDIVGTDTAFVFSLTTMEAGDYSAHVTVGETDVPCTSMVDIHFTIAISGQMFSKWTDVLFIGNKEGRFTAYQWFSDGAAMSGETMQRLYNPNGLSGSAVLYHCRLTTTDGKTLYTCPQTFDDVTPSRSVDTTPAQVKATTLYDTMGRVIKTTPHNGMYIVVEELENGEIQTRKITVYE